MLWQVEEGRLLDTSRGMAAAVPGWVALRLLAPAADVRLLLAASPTAVDSSRLGCRTLPSSSSWPVLQTHLGWRPAEGAADGA